MAQRLVDRAEEGAAFLFPLLARQAFGRTVEVFVLPAIVAGHALDVSRTDHDIDLGDFFGSKTANIMEGGILRPAKRKRPENRGAPPLGTCEPPAGYAAFLASITLAELLPIGIERGFMASGISRTRSTWS